MPKSSLENFEVVLKNGVNTFVGQGKDLQKACDSLTSDWKATSRGKINGRSLVKLIHKDKVSEISLFPLMARRFLENKITKIVLGKRLMILLK